MEEDSESTSLLLCADGNMKKATYMNTSTSTSMSMSMSMSMHSNDTCRQGVDSDADKKKSNLGMTVERSEEENCKEHEVRIQQVHVQVEAETGAESEKADDEDEDEDEATYLRLLTHNRPFRLSFFSYLISHCGEWFTYIASIELLETILNEDGNGTSSPSRMHISMLVVCKLVPYIIFIPFSGVLADARDKRQSMMTLDALGIIAPSLFLVAHYSRSIPLIYACTLFQASIFALYEPCRVSLVTLIVEDGEYIKKATTLMGLAWSAMAAIGSGLGGVMVAIIGINACFILDSFTYVISWVLLWMIGGEWDVSENNDKHMGKGIWERLEDMTVEGLRYIMNCTFWPLILIRTTTSLVYGGSDIINVSFAEEVHSLNEAETSRRLGILYFNVGFGCLVGPLISERFTNAANPRTILKSAAIGFAIEGIGCLGVWYFTEFKYTAFFTFVRSGGSSISWVDGEVLLQILVDPQVLGRVIALDTGMALAGEGASAIIAGVLQDYAGQNARQVSLFLGVVAFIFFVLWAIYEFAYSESIFRHCNTIINSGKLTSVEKALNCEEGRRLFSGTELSVSSGEYDSSYFGSLNSGTNAADADGQKSMSINNPSTHINCRRPSRWSGDLQFTFILILVTSLVSFCIYEGQLHHHGHPIHLKN